MATPMSVHARASEGVPEAFVPDIRAAFDVNNWSPVYIGPTWQTDADGDWILPERTLGWEVATWAATWLTNDEGDPWMFTAEQLRYVLWFYSLDKRGRFVYSDSLYQRLKGHGKDPLAAAICMAELIGPCRFDHWDADGQPVAKDNPAAWVQLAAVSADQTRTTMSLFPLMLPLRTTKHFGIELGKEKIYALSGRRRLEILTSSFRSQEGARVTFVVMGETHHWLHSNGGHDLYDVITRNRTKSKGGTARALQITNAYQPGEDSVAERTREAHDKTVDINPATGRPYAAFAGLLYDSLEAPSNAPLDPVVAPYVLEKIRGDSIWLDIESIVNFIVDTRNPPSLSRRFWYNQITADEETLIPPAMWDPLKADKTLASGDEIVLGFDGSRTRDATALVAIRVADQHIVPLGIWERTKDVVKWEVPREEVVGAVDNAFSEYRVVAFFSDVHPWESYVDVWSNKYREVLLVKASGDHSIGYNMSGHQQDITEANMRFVAAVADRTFTHNGDPTLRRHVMQCRKMFNKWGMTFTKEGRENDRFNDAYAATLLAFIALGKYLESGKRPKAKLSGRVWQFP